VPDVATTACPRLGVESVMRGTWCQARAVESASAPLPGSPWPACRCSPFPTLPRRRPWP